MIAWYKHKPKLFEAERASLAASCPLMGLSVVGPGYRVNQTKYLDTEAAIARGTYGIRVPETRRLIEYGIVLVTPPNYPDRPPVMYGNDPKLPLEEIDRHVVANGQACLAVNAEITMRWRTCSTLVGFLEALVKPFLAWQAYYDAHGQAPPWGERDHGPAGVLAFYRDLCGDLAMSPTSVRKFMEMLAVKKKPRGHEKCPCGSGKRLRDCHMKMVIASRRLLKRRDVMSDLRYLNHA